MDATLVEVTQGSIEGISNTTSSGFEFISFNGIPYAKPPIGDLRFQNPQPADSWTGIWDGTYEREMAPQFEPFVMKQCVGSEDCLYLNVHVPKMKNCKTPLPVLIWIHGGAFQIGSGSSTMYGPDYLVEKNIIVVSVNYRLGVLGFTCLNLPEAPGNLGLKDQNLAIKWVNSNIHYFNGDKNNITLMGESAGSVCVQFHILSPLSTGLFHKAICSSGSCYSGWGIKDDPEANIWRLAKGLNHHSKDKKELLAHMKSLPASDLIDCTKQTFRGEMAISFCPVVEKPFPNQEAFFTKHPTAILKSGKFCHIPIINGFNSNEGLFFALPPIGLYNEEKFSENVMKDLIEKTIVDISFEYQEKIKNKKIVEKIQKFYVKPNDLFQSFVNYMTDLEFSVSSRSASLAFSKFIPPIYQYYFSYNGSINLLQLLNKKKYKGAAHSDELTYIFNNLLVSMNNVTPSEKDLQVRRNLVTLFSNFIYYGDPTPKTKSDINVKWLPFKENQENCLVIDEDLKMCKNVLSNRFAFWNQLLVDSKL